MAKKTTKKTTPTAKKAPSDNAAKIKALLDDLRAAKTGSDKKQIRRALRALGHTGGLGIKRGKKP